MVNSPKSGSRQVIEDIVAFHKSNLLISLLATFILVALAFKDILYLRFGTSILGESYQYSDASSRLLIDGFNGNLSRNFSEKLPTIALIVLVSMVSYSLYSTYKRTYSSLNISKNYVNAKRTPPEQIALHYIILRSIAFAVPLLYWGYFFTAWFPAIASFPLRYIIGPNIATFVLSALLALGVLFALTHLGVILSRLAIRVFKYI